VSLTKIAAPRSKEIESEFKNSASTRPSDSHERKAAVELQALRDALRKLGLTPNERDVPKL